MSEDATKNQAADAPVGSDNKKSSRIAYFTPIHSIRRAGSSLSGARTRIAQTFNGFKNALPSRQSGVYDQDDLRSIDDPEQRFRAMYEEFGWTEEEILGQANACSRTKLVALSLALISLVATLGALFFAPIWMLLFVVPIGGSAVILGFAQAFKFALFETQINLKSLIDAKTFYAREDFFIRMIG